MYYIYSIIETNICYPQKDDDIKKEEIGPTKHNFFKRSFRSQSLMSTF